jgi:coiled-coil domain-containing protein 12
MATEATKPVIRFRNYKPHDATLRKEKVVDTEPPSSSSSSINANDVASTAVVATATFAAPAVVPEVPNSKRKREVVDVIKKELAQHTEEELNIIPKKPNWDLKCQVEDRIQKLKRKTQRAIVDILREKLAADAINDIDE